MGDPAPAQAESYKALLIEDDAAQARHIGNIIQQMPGQPFSLDLADSLHAGLERIGNGAVDILLLDLDLPDSQGLDTVARAVAQNLAMPIIVCLEKEDPLLAIEALGRGAQDCLLKTELDASLLLRAMRYAIQRHAMQAALQHLSLIDELTGVYNRRGFMALAEQQMKLAQRSNRALMLAFADLDNLKGINDRFGHSAGDDAILRAAEALRRTFRNSDIIGRMGGDEFTVLLVDALDDSRTIIDSRLQRILEDMNTRLRLPFNLSMSLGTAKFEPDANMSVEDLLDKADQALYLRKRDRRKT
jgi:diguanylate cyclase (GGDEF)-like protein